MVLPSQVNKTARSVTASGTPYKTVSYENTLKDGAPVMLITEQRQGAWPPSIQNGKWKATM